MSQSINLYKQLANHKLFNKTINFNLKRIKLVLKKLNNPEKKLNNVINFLGSSGKFSTLFSVKSFIEANIENEEFYIPHFNVCMEATENKAGSSLKLSSCDKNDNQKFILKNDGKIQLKSNLNLCLTASENFREGGGGNPVHLIRSLTLENCDNALSSYQNWGIRVN